MEEQPLSKSEQKRRATRVQLLGKALTELRPAQLSALALPEKLAAAVADYQRFPSREARRRQLQFIGRLMRDLDTTLIESALDSLHGQSAEAQYEFHQAERWRARLLEAPEALTEFLAEYPHTDRQRLRHQLQRVHQAKNAAQQRTASRELFRFLRTTLQKD